jgi:hypothetical protein
MVKKIWGLVDPSEIWKCENGEPLIPDDLHPTVDVLGRRLYGIRKNNEQDAVLVQTYHPTAQKNGAFDFARFAWGQPDKWTKPDLSNRVIACLGAPACAACIDEPVAIMDLAHHWRIEPYEFSNELTARRILDWTDPECELTTTEHTLARVTELADLDKIHAELMRRCVSLFGAPVDMATGVVAPMYANLYRSYEQ